MSLIRSIDPWTGAVLKEFSAHSPQEVEIYLNLAEQTFSSWKELPIPEKARLMRRVAALLLERKETLARIISQEVGKVIRESRAEIEKCAWVCDFYAENAASFLTPEEILLPDSKRAQVIFQPLGIVLGVMPWNFPFWQTFRFAIPALLTGNTVLLKHAPNVFGCATQIEELFLNADLPKGVFQNLIIHHNRVENLIANDIISAVTFTGSEKAGAIIGSLAGKYLKKSVLELGGSNAFIVCADANIDLAVSKAITGRFLNGGQSCIAAKRFIVSEEVYNEFTTKLVAQVKSLNTGNPFDESTDLGPLARIDLAQNLQEQIQKSVAMGAEIIYGGNQSGAYHEPTILVDVSNDMPVFKEETFGPVAVVIKVNSIEESLNLSEDSKYGLGVSIFTSNIEKAEEMASEVSDGACFINEFVKSDPRLPFGGTKKSGYGRELGKDGMLEFVNRKTIYIDKV